MIDKNKMIEVSKNIIKNNGLPTVSKICKGVRCDECVFSCYLINSKEELVKKAKIYLEDNGVDEMKTEKTFKEVIADIKEGEVWESNSIAYDIKTIEMYNDSIEIKRRNMDNEIFIRKETLFKLQRKQYNFTEAFKAYEEGKEIEDYRGTKYKKINRLDHYKCEYETDFSEKADQYDYWFSFDEIRGKWYINN